MEGHLAAARRPPLALDRVHGGLGQPGRVERLVGAPAADDAAVDVAHAHEPLLGQVGLDGRLGAIGVTDLHRVLVDALHETESV